MWLASAASPNGPPESSGRGLPHARTGKRPRGPVKQPPMRCARVAADGAGGDASVRSHRRRRAVHHGLMYWNSDRF